MSSNDSRSRQSQFFGFTLHARDQMLARHGLAPTLDEWRQAARSIREGAAVLLSRHDADTGPALIYSVVLGGKEVRVVWRDDTIITVLPSNSSIVKRLELNKTRGIRPSFDNPGKWIRGKRLTAGTHWTPKARDAAMRADDSDDEDTTEW